MEAQSIRWESDWDMALAQARVQEKYVMVDFSNPGCSACQQMKAVTYPHALFVRFVDRNLIAHRIEVNAPGPKPAEFRIQYTPTVVIVDGRGKEHHRCVGFLPPEEFIPSLMLGVAKAHTYHGRSQIARGMLDALLFEYPRSRSAAEAMDLRKRLPQ
jgi:thioredoxin-related protein